MPNNAHTHAVLVGHDKGVAPGYGEGRPSAKQSELNSYRGDAPGYGEARPLAKGPWCIYHNTFPSPKPVVKCYLVVYLVGSGFLKKHSFTQRLL